MCPSTRSDSAARIYSFDRYEFRTLPPRLTRDGVEIELRRQCLWLLDLLLENAGDPVTRREISERLWAEEADLDRETAINSVVSCLRRALRDDSASPAYIETLPRKGYRFVAPVARGSDARRTREPRLVRMARWLDRWRRRAARMVIGRARIASQAERVN